MGHKQAGSEPTTYGTEYIETELLLTVIAALKEDDPEKTKQNGVASAHLFQEMSLLALKRLVDACKTIYDTGHTIMRLNLMMGNYPQAQMDEFIAAMKPVLQRSAAEGSESAATLLELLKKGLFGGQGTD